MSEAVMAVTMCSVEVCSNGKKRRAEKSRRETGRRSTVRLQSEYFDSFVTLCTQFVSFSVDGSLGWVQLGDAEV